MKKTDKIFYIDFDFITITYPYKASQRIKDFGVLEQYRDKKYTLKQINEIIAILIMRIPYVSGAMDIHISVKYGENGWSAYHHILDIYNYSHEKQKIKDEIEVKFLFD